MLNKEQIEVKEGIINFIKGDKNGFFGVLGSGGTGKTYTVTKSINTTDVIFLGATNKVCKVLREGLIDFFNPNIQTIDKFLGFSMSMDENNNQIVSYKDLEADEIPEIIVIDEISLLGDSHYKKLLELKDLKKFILIGDDKQIPPIDAIERDNEGFKVSKIFNALDYRYTLTIQNRQKEGTGLSNLITGFRGAMGKKIDFRLMAEKKSNDKDVFYIKSDSELNDILKGDNIIVSYTNQTINLLGWKKGSLLSGKRDYKSNDLNPGDYVFFNSFYKHKDVKHYTTDLVEILDIKLNVNESFVIKGFKVSYKYDEITILKGGSKEVIRRSISDKETLYPFRYRKTKLVKSAESKTEKAHLNTLYHTFKTSFAKLKKPYAITCHKSQGSTFDTVIIPIYDFASDNHKDINQLMYVAMSRAKKRLIFIDKKTNLNGKNKRVNFTSEERNYIASLNDYKCKNCFDYVSMGNFDIDHITPLKQGGNNLAENLQPLCKECHIKKHKPIDNEQRSKELRSEIKKVEKRMLLLRNG